VIVRDLRPDDWPSVCAIYEDGIRSGDATFETETPTWEAWDAGTRRIPRRGTGR
jgi:phosphinothricin acetyltransferase